MTQVEGVTKVERVATLALLLNGTGLLAKSGDVVVNSGAGAFLYVLFEYVTTLAKSSSGGQVRFIVIRGNRILQTKFTNKQHRQCQLAIAISPVLILLTGHLININLQILMGLRLNHRNNL